MKRNFALLLSLIIILFSCSDKDDPLTEGLLLYCPFDGNTLDESIYDNNGIDSTSGNYVTGRWGKAIDFNGTSDFIILPKTFSVEYGLSFSFWIKTRGAISGQNNGAILSKYNMKTHERCFMVYSFGAYETNNDDRLSVSFYNGGYPLVRSDHVKSYMEASEFAIFPDPSLWKIINPVRLEREVWTHCVINITPDFLETWINGELCVKKKREYQTYYDSRNEPIYIGNNAAGGEGSNNHFNGALDELRIYNRELSTQEIRKLFEEK